MVRPLRRARDASRGSPSPSTGQGLGPVRLAPRALCFTGSVTSSTDTGTSTRTGISMRSATLRYTALRLGIFAASFVVIAALAYVGVLPEGIGASNPFWIALLAILVSAPISLVVLRRQRDAMSEQLAPRVARARERLNANRSMEDTEE
jgi:hypothetical protein